MTKNLDQKLLFALMLAVFLDIGNFFMPMPVYSPLFLDSPLLQHLPHSIKSIMLGGLIACYGAAQLFGGPILGKLSDQYGRKKILIFSLSASMLGCLISAIGLTTSSIILIYVSRLIIGFASGTIAVIFALTADFSKKNEYAKNLGYVTIGTALGATLGPLIGGYLTSLHLTPWLEYSLPFYVMAILYFLNIVLLWNLANQKQENTSQKSIYLFSAFKNIQLIATKSKLLYRLMLMALLFQIGTESFYLSAPIFAVKILHLSPGDIGNHFMLQGVTALIASLCINKYISNYFKSISIYLVSAFFLMVSFSFLLSNPANFIFYIPFIGIGLFGKLCWIHINALFSNTVDKTQHGLIFGVSQSLWSIGGIIGSILTSLIAAIHLKIIALLPTTFELFSLIAAIFVAISLSNKKTYLP